MTHANLWSDMPVYCRAITMKNKVFLCSFIRVKGQLWA